jgi:hypothetical protein
MTYWMPRNGMTSFQWFKHQWVNKREPKTRLIEFLLERLPGILWIKGELHYNSLRASWGSETWYAPHNLWRMPFHLAQGFLIAYPLSIFLPWWVGVSIVLGMALKREWDDYKRIGFHFKNVMDVLDRTGGALLGALWL